jgi:hypothetical protein
MANLRELKKDINYLVLELISDCFMYSDFHPGEKTDELSALISEAVDLRNDLITRVNNPLNRDDPKTVRSHFQTIKKDLLTGIDTLFGKLSALSGEKQSVDI